MLPEIETILTPPNAVSELNIPEGLSHMGKKQRKSRSCVQEILYWLPYLDKIIAYFSLCTSTEFYT